MSELMVFELQGQLVVDSRLVAEELGIAHRGLRQTIEKYLTELQGFGTITFEMSSSNMPDGRINPKPERYCYLNEEQATFLMTLSRNTPQVVACKQNLVKAFSKAKQLIKEVVPQQSDRIRELELQNLVLDKQIRSKELDHSMLILHGAPLVLALRGRDDQIVEVEKKVLEVIDERCGDKRKGMTTAQLNAYLKQKTGFSFKSGAELERYLQKAAPELLDLVQRAVNQSFINEENIEQAIAVLARGSRQLLIGE